MWIEGVNKFLLCIMLDSQIQLLGYIKDIYFPRYSNHITINIYTLLINCLGILFKLLKTCSESVRRYRNIYN